MIDRRIYGYLSSYRFPYLEQDNSLSFYSKESIFKVFDILSQDSFTKKSVNHGNKKDNIRYELPFNIHQVAAEQALALIDSAFIYHAKLVTHCVDDDFIHNGNAFILTDLAILCLQAGFLPGVERLLRNNEKAKENNVDFRACFSFVSEEYDFPVLRHHSDLFFWGGQPDSRAFELYSEMCSLGGYLENFKYQLGRFDASLGQNSMVLSMALYDNHEFWSRDEFVSQSQYVIFAEDLLLEDYSWRDDEEGDPFERFPDGIDIIVSRLQRIIPRDAWIEAYCGFNDIHGFCNLLYYSRDIDIAIDALRTHGLDPFLREDSTNIEVTAFLEKLPPSEILFNLEGKTRPDGYSYLESLISNSIQNG